MQIFAQDLEPSPPRKVTKTDEDNPEKLKLYEEMKSDVAKYSVVSMNYDEQFDYDNYVVADSIYQLLDKVIMLNTKIKQKDVIKLKIHLTPGKELTNLKRLHHHKHWDNCVATMDCIVAIHTMLPIVKCRIKLCQ